MYWIIDVAGGTSFTLSVAIIFPTPVSSDILLLDGPGFEAPWSTNINVGWPPLADLGSLVTLQRPACASIFIGSCADLDFEPTWWWCPFPECNIGSFAYSIRKTELGGILLLCEERLVGNSVLIATTVLPPTLLGLDENSRWWLDSFDVRLTELCTSWWHTKVSSTRETTCTEGLGDDNCRRIWLCCTSNISIRDCFEWFCKCSGSESTSACPHIGQLIRTSILTLSRLLVRCINYQLVEYVYWFTKFSLISPKK